ncbi:MAG: GNAT family protein [Alphaproteobacteria bacterium]|nr:GNAT family protein [Alphaproteobacteria bacterium]
MLRLTEAEDWHAWRFLREQGRSYLEPWEPEWPSYALSYGHFCSLLRRSWREWRAGRGYAFSILLKQEPLPILVGGITLNNIQYAAAQKGTVGYWMGQPYAGQGYMTEALGLVCDFAFSFLNLQRVEASCLPHNEASKTVLRHCGFEQEGYAKDYMQINGVRQDHLLWGKNRLAAEHQSRLR